MTRTPEELIFDGDQARQVLENEQFAQAFNDIEQEITEAWKNSPVRDEQGRQELFRLLLAAKKFRSMLETRLNTGKLTQLELEQQRTMLEIDRAKGLSIAGWGSPYS